MKKYILILLVCISIKANAGFSSSLVKVSITLANNYNHTGFVEVGDWEFGKIKENKPLSDKGLMELVDVWRKEGIYQSLELYQNFFEWKIESPFGGKIILVDSLDYKEIKLIEIKDIKYISHTEISPEGFKITVVPAKLLEKVKKQKPIMEHSEFLNPMDGYFYFSFNPMINKAEIKRLNNLSPVYRSDGSIDQNNLNRTNARMIKEDIIPVYYEVWD